MASQEILRHEIVEEAIDALERSASRLFFSGLSAGLDIGFSLFLMAVMRTMAEGHTAAEPSSKFSSANMYSFGFMLVVLGRSELFTEQTTLAVIAGTEPRGLGRRRCCGSGAWSMSRT